jgi:hypothetical protein
VGRLKSTLYARMEEMSFRSGAAVSAGVLAAGVAITVAVVPGGQRADGRSACVYYQVITDMLLQTPAAVRNYRLAVS